MDLEMRGLLTECISSSSLLTQMPKQQQRRNFSDCGPAAFVYKKQMQQHIHEHKRQVSSLLVNLLLRGSPDPTRPYLNLSCLVTLLSNVCLFASGDCMDDFCCALFSLSPLLKPSNSHEVDQLIHSSFQSVAVPSSSLENYGGDSWIALLPHIHFSIVPVEDATLNGISFLDKFNRISMDIDIPWPLSVLVQIARHALWILGQDSVKNLQQSVFFSLTKLTITDHYGVKVRRGPCMMGLDYAKDTAQTECDVLNRHKGM
ncbi:unnamed protein product [Dibothriocephalus latus]|uniref:Uncharacterized protein n=1 Tax=Dibothriocephalus latus TaxID=60516 RepID=A0A3P7PHP3_DIBLA|nr:unnamed protein product [Dibothriocephalus latus]